MLTPSSSHKGCHPNCSADVLSRLTQCERSHIFSQRVVLLTISLMICHLLLIHLQLNVCYAMPVKLSILAQP